MDAKRRRRQMGWISIAGSRWRCCSVGVGVGVEAALGRFTPPLTAAPRVVAWQHGREARAQRSAAAMCDSLWTADHGRGSRSTGTCVGGALGQRSWRERTGEGGNRGFRAWQRRGTAAPSDHTTVYGVLGARAGGADAWARRAARNLISGRAATIRRCDDRTMDDGRFGRASERRAGASRGALGGLWRVWLALGVRWSEIG